MPVYSLNSQKASFNALIKKLRSKDFDSLTSEGRAVIPIKKQLTFYHSGDFGDIIYSLPTIRAMGGGRLQLGPCRYQTRQKMTPEIAAVILPLLRAQPYITEARYNADFEPVDIDLNQFREYLLRSSGKRHSLAQAHLHTFKLPLDECETQWLSVEPKLPPKPVLCHRSARWRNANFPWAKVMDTHRHQSVFVGLHTEYHEFCEDWGFLPYLPTTNFLELAQYIAGCRLYIGNQSAPYAIAEGLKKDSVLEVWLEGPNCKFKRRNAIYGESAIVYIPKLTTEMITILTACPVCGADASALAPCRKKTDIVKCSACAMIFLRTQPDREQTLMYYQQYADDHSHMRLPRNFDDVASSGLRRDYFMTELLTHCSPTGSLLDIGCGWGAFLANAREKGFKVTGIDICHKAANFSSGVLGIPTRCEQLEDCKFEAATFDVVSIIHTLEHLHDPAGVLKLIQSQLKPNGLLCGIVPNIESFCSQANQENWAWLDKNTHYVHFSPSTLRQTLVHFGFDVLRMYTHTGDYDQAELERLVRATSTTEMTTEALESFIQSLWDNGQGEEIRFFARKHEPNTFPTI